MTNPLIAAPEHEDAEPPNWEGAGLASSWADLDATVTADHVDPVEVLFAAAGAGLDSLGTALDPLDALTAAGIGWVIEHLWFLHEPLDALAGDPTQITAHARTWHNVAAELRAVAADHRERAALPGWHGAAGDAYRAEVDGFTASLEAIASRSAQLSGLILATGVAVGTTRALIRDAVAQLLTEVIFAVVTALATAGGALGLVVARVVADAVALAEGIARTVSGLLDALAAAGATAREVGEAVRDTAAQLRAAATPLLARAEDVTRTAEDAGLGVVIESGKQGTGAAQDRRDW